ncbi:oligoribonuclease [Frigoribacterium sp. NBH87]|uniref:oligoribonuclease n=1 Tax=Frigoribacterium sp. NBH87 TaxID=2596916 RepID=UPI00162349B5|nr:oligoribonuclease [Frigoribacterium sp. NBH87]QNE43148.1 oligoribonuclease [Frigoribacterium sp. NBH87]
MTDSKPTVAEGSEYVVFFEGGPSDGSTDTRTSFNGSYEDEIVDYVLVEGIETGFVYKVREAKMNGEQLQVHYKLDEADSDPVDALENRGDRTDEFGTF